MTLIRQCLLTVVGAGWLDAPLRPYPERKQEQEEWMAKRRRLNLERDMLALSERETELWALRAADCFTGPLSVSPASGHYRDDAGLGSQQR